MPEEIPRRETPYPKFTPVDSEGNIILGGVLPPGFVQLIGGIGPDGEPKAIAVDENGAIKTTGHTGTSIGRYVTLSSKTMRVDVTLDVNIFTTTYTFLLVTDAVLGEVRNKGGEFIPSVYKRVDRDLNQGIVQIMDSSPVPDESLEIFITLL